MALQEPSWKIWLAYTSHLPLRMAVTTLLRDAFVAGGANTEMELPLHQGFMAANLTPPQLRLELPIGDSPEFRGLLHDLLLAVWTRAEGHGLPLNTLGDPATLASRLNDELDAHKAFASFVVQMVLRRQLLPGHPDRVADGDRQPAVGALGTQLGPRGVGGSGLVRSPESGSAQIRTEVHRAASSRPARYASSSAAV